MLRKMVVPTMLAVTALAATVPAAASAQSFGFYVGSGYPAYYDEDARRDAWIGHERWQARQRWEREEARRRYWAHERWEQERAERAWNHERWERRHDWDEDDDD